jgi:N-acetylmuramic acid 6-phosphate etherase
MQKKSDLRATERRNPRSRGLDRMPTRELLRVISREDARVPAAVAREIPAIARAVDAIAAAMRRGGRLFYVGAGTSGRLGVLDAAECSPTFGVAPGRVQGLIAGGRKALVRAAEGAEDSAALGKHDLAAKKITRRDAVVGLTASGRTPYVLGALRYARSKGACTVGVTCNRNSPVSRLARIGIAPAVGPEVLAGSTRMKAGTAQKLVLNMLSTGVMVRLGHVYDNWMVGVAQTNRKLRQRAERILAEATGADVSPVRRALRQAGHDLRVALVMVKRNVGAEEARKRLRSAGGDLRAALGEKSSRVKGSKSRRDKNPDG